MNSELLSVAQRQLHQMGSYYLGPLGCMTNWQPSVYPEHTPFRTTAIFFAFSLRVFHLSSAVAVTFLSHCKLTISSEFPCTVAVSGKYETGL